MYEEVIDDRGRVHITLMPDGVPMPDGRSRGKNRSTRQRRRLADRDGQQCAYCKVPMKLAALTVDHVIPKALGGSNKDHNLVLACRPCNNGKGDRLISHHPVTGEVLSGHVKSNLPSDHPDG